MTQILVFCEKDEIAYELLSKGKRLKDTLNAKLTAAIVGKGAESKANDYFAYGADTVYTVKDDAFADFHTDIYAEALSQIANNYGADTILIGSTKRGKELAPRVAQKLGAGCITDAIGIDVQDGNLLVLRNSLGGNTIMSQFISTPKKVVSVMPRTFELGEKQPKQGEVVAFTPKVNAPRLKIVERKEKKGESVNLEAAPTLVCIGRGLRQKEDMALIEKLAKAVKAEIGCTRPVAFDLRWLPEEREVGLSGKKCKPSLCIALGISGQIQYAVGVRDAKIIAAVNKDKNAPIFKAADYGIVGDLYEVVPKLIEKSKSA